MLLFLFQNYLEIMKNEPVQKRDATGNFIAYLINIVPVFAFNLKGRYDIGGLDSYIECNNKHQN